jgi:acyl-CoA thioester hydrolase
MRHRGEILVRWGDMDSMAHINNIAWTAYLQEARAQMFGFRLRGTAAESLLGHLVVAKVRVRFLRPMLASTKPLVAHTWISAVRAASLTVECELGDDPAGPYCVGTTTLAPFDFAANRLRRLHEAEREALSEFTEPATLVS